MAKNKKVPDKKEMTKGKSRKKSFGSKPIVWIVLGVLLVVVIVMLARKDGNSGYVSNELQALVDNCVVYANGGLRSEFCGYNLINGDLVNCRDSRVLDKLTSESIDTSISSLNCRNIDIYTFRKSACSGYSAETKIADTTCAAYQ